MPEKMPTQAYVWNLNNPNKHETELQAPSPVTCISYNHKNQDWIGGGCYNGLVCTTSNYICS